MVINAEAIVIRKHLEQSLRELPPLPAAITKVIDETSKADPDLHTIDKAISSDTVLAAKVLRIVNSAYYGLSRQVSSVSQAVMIIGLSQVRTITLSVGSMSALSGNKPIDTEGTQRFWKHAFGTSAACQILASQCGLDHKSLDTLNTIGILHDVGRMFLFVNFDEVYDRFVETAKEKNWTYETSERELLGESHAEIGAIIAEKWGLPIEVVDVIRNHEGPFDPLNLSKITAIVHVADWLNKDAYYGANKDPIGSLSPILTEALGLDSEKLSQIRESVRKKVSEADQMFG
jgi:putative nucleotidyltransferase with HDIG domain